jgi:hypothetical protein
VLAAHAARRPRCPPPTLLASSEPSMLTFTLRSLRSRARAAG